MNEIQFLERAHKVMNDLQTLGWSNTRIELFWLQCIKKTAKGRSLLQRLQLSLKILKRQAILGIESVHIWFGPDYLRPGFHSPRQVRQNK